MKPMNSHLILGVGELLWDLLPEPEMSLVATGEDPAIRGSLGGAPANFAVMAARLGNRATVLSRIGRDELGRRAMALLDGLPADSGHVQIDAAHETGRVTVAIKDGQPEYTIHKPAAWDFLELSDDWVQLAERADAICFGSLAQRSAESRQTIQALVAQTSAKCVRIFDVNLRTPFYSSEVLEESLELATVMKMNDDEVPLVMRLLGLPVLSVEERASQEVESLRTAADRLLAEFPSMQMVAVTRGAHGSLLVRRDGWHAHPGVKATVADTIGAGDAFTAAMVHFLLQGAELPVLNEAGNRWGAWVASQAGAMPVLTDSTRERITLEIEGSRRAVD